MRGANLDPEQIERGRALIRAAAEATAETPAPAADPTIHAVRRHRLLVERLAEDLRVLADELDALEAELSTAAEQA